MELPTRCPGEDPRISRRLPEDWWTDIFSEGESYMLGFGAIYFDLPELDWRSGEA